MIFRLKSIYVGVSILLSLYSQGQKRAESTINGYCFYTFIYDTITQCYYPKNSTFIDSITGKKFSIVKRSNLTAYTNDCKGLDKVVITETEPYLGVYSLVHDSAFANVFLEGVFYIDSLANHVYAIFKFNGKGIIINKACKKYLENYRVNNWNVKHAEICHDYLKLPQVYLNSTCSTYVLTEKDLFKLRMKKTTLNKIRFCECI